MKKIALLSTAISLSSLILSHTVTAHVVVQPSEVTTASYQTFTVGVPNEKTIPTVAVKLIVPGTLAHVSPTQKSGWNITTETTGNGEDAAVTAITWSGSAIAQNMRDDFTFSAKAPSETTNLQWKAYQTYADGTTVAWDTSEAAHSHTSNSGPFSVTNVVTTTDQQAALNSANEKAATATTSARRSLSIAIAGVITGLIGIFLATRRR